MPVFGPHPVTVPGRGRGVVHAHREVRDAVVRRARAARAALRGGGLPGHEARRLVLREQRDPLRPLRPPDFHDAYGDVAPGDWIRQPELARTIRTLADDGPDAYYRGPIGAAIAERLQHAGGCMTAADVAAHAGAWVEPLRAPFRDVEILEMPPPTQGLTALEALRIVDGLDLGVRRPRSRAPADRGGEARAGRPPAVPRRSRRDDDRARNGFCATTGSRRGARASIRKAQQSERARRARRRHDLHVRGRPRRHAGEPHPVELQRRGFRAARGGVGPQPAQPRVGVRARRRAPERHRARARCRCTR